MARCKARAASLEGGDLPAPPKLTCTGREAATSHSERRESLLLKEIMTHNIEVVSPGDTVEQAAQKMAELNVGPMPVCEGNRVVGMLTDRDITVRATAAGCDPKTTLVSDA